MKTSRVTIYVLTVLSVTLLGHITQAESGPTTNQPSLDWIRYSQPENSCLLPQGLVDEVIFNKQLQCNYKDIWTLAKRSTQCERDLSVKMGLGPFIWKISVRCEQRHYTGFETTPSEAVIIIDQNLEHDPLVEHLSRTGSIMDIVESVDFILEESGMISNHHTYLFHSFIDSTSYRHIEFRRPMDESHFATSQ